MIHHTLTEVEIDARLLHYGDIVRVKAGDIFGADGVVVGGQSMAEESALTGEFLPLTKTVGSMVYAGTRNVESTLDVQVTKLVFENILTQLAHMVQQSRAKRLPAEDIADRIAAFVLVCSCAVAVAALLIWMLVERFVRRSAWSTSGVTGLTYAISVVAVACPCALVLATPLVVTNVLGVGLRAGIVIRNSSALAELPLADVFAFDKTGTLTDGQMRVVDFNIYSHTALPIVAALVADQKHPISRAIASFVKDRLKDSILAEKQPAIDEVEVVPGQGLRSIFASYPLLGGSAWFTQADPIPLTGALQHSYFYVTLGTRLIAHFGLRDSLRHDAKDLITALRDLGKQVVLISGDLDGPVQTIGKELDIESADLHSRCSPSGKLELVESFQASGKRVCFVGDGVNDAPALGIANVSITITDGTDAAQAIADVILNSHSSLKDALLNAVSLAKLTSLHVRAALGWSIFYNVFAVLFASGAFVNVRIEPKWAGLGEIISLLPVFFFAYSTRWTWKWRSEN